MSGKFEYLLTLILAVVCRGDLREMKPRAERTVIERSKKRRLSDSNTRGHSPTAIAIRIAGDPVNHSGKAT